MARRLALKTVPLNGVINGAGGPEQFNYGSVMLNMLRVDRGQGMSFDEVVRSVEAIGPIQKALDEGGEAVTLTDEQWRTLQDRLMRYQFGLAHEAIVDFGRMILDAPEIGAGG
jgi:hypothetical protein